MYIRCAAAAAAACNYHNKTRRRVGSGRRIRTAEENRGRPHVARLSLPRGVYRTTRHQTWSRRSFGDFMAAYSRVRLGNANGRAGRFFGRSRVVYRGGESMSRVRLWFHANRKRKFLIFHSSSIDASAGGGYEGSGGEGRRPPPIVRVIRVTNRFERKNNDCRVSITESFFWYRCHRLSLPIARVVEINAINYNSSKILYVSVLSTRFKTRKIVISLRYVIFCSSTL